MEFSDIDNFEYEIQSRDSYLGVPRTKIRQYHELKYYQSILNIMGVSVGTENCVS